MTQLLDWLSTYSPPIVLLIVLGAGLLFVIKLIVEKTIAAQFDAKAKVFETLIKRRSAFEEKVLTERFALVTGLSARLERIMTTLNRSRAGHPEPEGFRRQGEIIPLTEVYEDLEIHRLVLGEEFYRLFSFGAKLAIRVAQPHSPEVWAKTGEEWIRLREDIRLAADATFGISMIRW
jgi:hypothetical protein